MAEIKNKTLWMRNVDFEMLMNFAHFVFMHHNQYRPQQLEEEATKAGLFSKGNKTFGHTTKFNYRKILEHLNFISICNGKYLYNQKQDFQDFIIDFNNNQSLSDQNKVFISEQIVNNNDCKEYFFDLISAKNKYTVDDIGDGGGYLLAKSTPRSITTQGGKTIGGIVLSSSLPQKKEVFLDTTDKIQAIFWGIRKWSYDFQITDEFFYSSTKGRIIYPISKNYQETTFMNYLFDYIFKGYRNDDWISIHIPTLINDFILESRKRPSVENIKRMIVSFVEDNKKNIIYIPTSASVIESKIPTASQVQEYKKCFIHLDKFGYISHIKINKKGLYHE